MALKAIYRSCFALVSHTALLPILRPWFRADHPLTALAQGEHLVQSRRILALTAHEDDLEFFCGGTLRRTIEMGGKVIAAVLTDGEKGGNLPALNRVRLGEEQRAARDLGYSKLKSLHLTDYGFPEDPRLVPVLERLIQRYRPDCLLAFEPRGETPGFINRDHTTLGQRIVELAPDLYRQKVRVYLYATRHPNTLVDIHPVMRRKIQAIFRHRSQLRYLERDDYIHLVHWFSQLYSPSPPRAVEPFYRLI